MVDHNFIRNVFDYARGNPQEFTVLEGRIDSVVDKEGVVSLARLDEGMDYRRILCFGPSSYYIKLNEIGSLQTGLFDYSRENPLFRVFCERGDQVSALAWNQDLKGCRNSDERGIIKIPVRAYWNKTASFFDLSDALKDHLEKNGIITLDSFKRSRGDY